MKNFKGENVMSPVNGEEIKKAIDSFEDDDYVASKEVIRQQIANARDEYLKTKLELKGKPAVELDPENKEE